MPSFLADECVGRTIVEGLVERGRTSLAHKP
jgi:hypothetical protein